MYLFHTFSSSLQQIYLTVVLCIRKVHFKWWWHWDNSSWCSELWLTWSCIFSEYQEFISKDWRRFICSPRLSRDLLYFWIDIETNFWQILSRKEGYPLLSNPLILFFKDFSWVTSHIYFHLIISSKVFWISRIER